MTTLDERADALLGRLEALCADGGYHILEQSELPCSAEETGETLAYLAGQRCVEVRYAEGGTYCLRLLPAGRAYVSRARERARLERRRLGRMAAVSFAGAFAGGLLSAAVALLVLLVGG